jgi:hypothetical protein
VRHPKPGIKGKVIEDDEQHGLQAPTQKVITFPVKSFYLRVGAIVP